ncbi:hypothetical protein TNIN_57951 [Trichonephila inaurata madagascariensis]|uniref:Uncharacterized protein n=1 Tax=Trichonephila inaurata madagascariensis TaxID=2747483 RepID=A0A8X6X5S7_9ARAC|nr:hypothetical protein TNIN_57951 [Trichonephila inaurata madagascariensis]
MLLDHPYPSHTPKSRAKLSSKRIVLAHCQDAEDRPRVAQYFGEGEASNLTFLEGGRPLPWRQATVINVPSRCQASFEDALRSIKGCYNRVIVCNHDRP